MTHMLTPSQGDSLGQEDSHKKGLGTLTPTDGEPAPQGPTGAVDPLPTHLAVEAKPALPAGRGGAMGLGKWAGHGKQVLI